MYRYYYETMNRAERQVYTLMEEGLSAGASRVRVPHLGIVVLSDIFARLKLDVPRLCYIRTVKFRGVRDAEHVELIPEYGFDASGVRSVLQTVDTRVRKVTAPMREMTPDARVKYVHDWILDNVHYDKLYKNYAHEVTGPLCHGTAVCEGIAKTVKILLDAVGIESIVVIGKEDTEQHGVNGMRHAWNMIRIGGKWMHVDATFDLSLTRCGVKRYDYFGLSDRALFVDHRESVYSVPAVADHAESYYIREKLCADSPEKLQSLLTRLLKKKGAACAFCYAEPLDRAETASVCAAFAESRGKRARISFNPNRRIALLTLADPSEMLQHGENDEIPTA